MTYTKPIAIQNFAGYRCMSLTDAVGELIDEGKDFTEAMEIAHGAIEHKVTFGDAKFTLFEGHLIWLVADALMDEGFIYDDVDEDDDPYEAMKIDVELLESRFDLLYVPG